jgi:hypothetical protein
MVALFDHHRLLTELRQMRVVEKSSGKLRLEHPRDEHGHGDAATAFALALLAARDARTGCPWIQPDVRWLDEPNVDWLATP